MATNTNLMSIAPVQATPSTRTTSQSAQPKYKSPTRAGKKNFSSTLDKINAKLDELKQGVKDLKDVEKDAAQGEDEAPKLDAEKVDVPEFNAPKLDAEKVDVPKLNAPKLDAQKLDVPEFNAPKLDAEKVDVPKLNAPKLDAQKLDVPEFNAPKLDAQKLDVPKLDVEKTNEQDKTPAQGKSNTPQDATQKAIRNLELGIRNDSELIAEENPPADIFLGARKFPAIKTFKAKTFDAPKISNEAPATEKIPKQVEDAPEITDEQSQPPTNILAANSMTYLFGMNSESLLKPVINSQLVEIVKEISPVQNLQSLLPTTDNNAQSMLQMLGGGSWKIQAQPLEVIQPSQPTLQAQPVEVIQTPQPTTQAQPVEVIQTPQPTTQAQPVEVIQTPQPTAQAQPVEVIQPSQPTTQAQPVEVIQTPQPTTQAQPVEVIQTSQPTTQAQPVEVIQTPQPTAQAQPVEVVQPSQPTTQAQPVEVIQTPQPTTQAPPVEVIQTSQPTPQPVEVVQTSQPTPQPVEQIQIQTAQPILQQKIDERPAPQNISELLGVNVQIEEAPTAAPVTAPQAPPQQFNQNPQQQDAQNFQPQTFQPIIADEVQAQPVSTGGEIFAANLSATSDAPQTQPATPTQAPEAPPPPPQDNFDIPAQIVRQARLIRTTENSEMVIKLNPEHLGELTLRVSVSSSGAVNASFHSDNAQVRTIIENSLVQLRNDLNNAGLKVENVQVYAGLSDGGGLMNGQGGQAWQQNRRQSSGNRRINFDSLERDVNSTAPVNEAQSADGVDYSV